MIGIIGAMDEEISVISSEIKNLTVYDINNMKFYKGKIYDKDIVLVKSGIGMVNASITTTLLFKEFGVDKILFSGVAGSLNRNVNIGDVVIGDSLLEYLFDATEFGYDIGTIPRMDTSIFRSDILLNKIKNILKNDNIYYGKILSGDKFVSNLSEKEKLGEKFNALAVDMESASVAHCAHVLGIEFAIIRSISDSLNSSSVMEYTEFVNLAANNSKNVILKILKGGI
ncbi:5'-methylthioadenosine/adenosylhomocysteine nucleosidase [Pseudostreptobacillus sp.]